MSGEIATLQDLLAGLAEHGEQEALLLVEAEQTRPWSYRRLATEVERVAAALIEMGVRPGDYVGLLGENRPEWIIAALAGWRAGAVIMPLDAQISEAGLGHVLADSGARFFFVGHGQEERLARLDSAADLRLIPLAELPGEAANPDLAVGTRRPEDPAALFYTSGTTGPAKGVPLSHANLVFQVNAIGATGLVTGADRVLLPLPFHHVYPLVIGLLVPLGLGLPLILPDALTGSRILRAIKEGRATTMIGVPRLYQAMYEGIVAKATAGGLPARLYFQAAAGLAAFCRRRFGLGIGRRLLAPLHRKLGPSLRLLASGGSALDPELALKLEALGWQVAIGYGLTETAPLLTINPPEGGRAGSVGRAVPGVELRIEPVKEDKAGPAGEEPDADRATGARPQIIGEVLARGPSVFAGYLNLPEKSAEAFAEGWFRTGDLGYLDPDGFLFLAGRASTLIVTAGGKNIQPEALEDAIAGHPLIREAGVLFYRDKLAALLVPDLAALRRAGEHEVEEALRRALLELSRDLPSYQRPDEYAVDREALPRTRLGKIRRHLLVRRYEQARAERQPEAAAEPIPLHDMSDHDRALLDVPAARAVWEWLARRYPQVRLSPDSSPHLDLGIDSLGWLNLAMELGRHADVELHEEAIGRIETVRDLLEEVVRLSEEGRGFNVADPLADPAAVLDAERRRWLAPLNRFQVGLAWCLYQLNRLLIRGIFRLRFAGRENLPAGPFVLAPNHVSFLDPFALAAALPFAVVRRTYFAGLSEIAFRNIFFRLVCRLGQVVPIDPRRATASSLAFGALILDRGYNLVWFPEGERSLSGRLLDFRPGLGMLLDRYRVFVVPAYIRGAYEAWPRGRSWPRPHPIRIQFGPAVHADQLAAAGTTTPAEPSSQGAAESREAAATRITKELQQKVAALADEQD
ncbi:AMP-binding protein [Desulfurivibrio sp. C05AmB]|uniref:AMP-binding protein n=1 Tax=Desulfurivibrio sp. C05AmB TaxID=3374371 RepID=UPI00376F225C